ncbi:MAG: alpha/beta hydrolase [Burkholderiales bacterium]|nr:alpha/beta hydrolase [Burkholderiales bacterium]
MKNFTVHGRRAAVYTGGKDFDPALPCLVFVHGALNDHSVWTLLARWFAHHGHAVLAPDLPGHGRSEGPPPGSVEAAADWVLALLDAAGVRQAAIAGHSMGSLIALEAAARAPERITRLVMIGSAYPMKVSPALLATARERPLAAIEMVTRFSTSTLAAKPSYPGPGMWLHGSTRALMRRTLQGGGGIDGCNLFEHDFRVCDAYAGGMEAAAKRLCPATLVVGRADQMTPPRATKELATALNASIVTLDAGHNLMAEQPEGVLAALRKACSAS